MITRKRSGKRDGHRFSYTLQERADAARLMQQVKKTEDTLTIFYRDQEEGDKIYWVIDFIIRKYKPVSISYDEAKNMIITFDFHRLSIFEDRMMIEAIYG